jgi:S-adenosylmethionine:tRNA ribosyltransferase-isomerase
VKVSEYQYELPADRIAQHPVEPRDAARLLTHEISRDITQHGLVMDLPQLLRRGDLLVVNNTRVRPARLCGVRGTGGRVELLVLGRESSAPPAAAQRWRALVKPAGRLRIGEEVALEGGALIARALERSKKADGGPSAEWILEIRDGWSPGTPAEAAMEKFGRMPLPPYIHRDPRPGAVDASRDADRVGYQTIFAHEPGAVAAPTAGLHFTPALLRRLEERGIAHVEVTLHVGAGTFQPVTAENVQDHVMHSEEYVLPAATARAISETRASGGRILAVGTTSARVLESCADEHGRLTAGQGQTAIFITPGHRFRSIDGLLTNFHLPRSTLLMLVSALAGRERVLRLYAEAISAGYRFYSYGDAMLLLP